MTMTRIFAIVRTDACHGIAVVLFERLQCSYFWCMYVYEEGKACGTFLASLPPIPFLWLSFFPCPSIFSAGELWDVDKSLDSGNNREPERKRELLSCVAVTAYITVCSG